MYDEISDQELITMVHESSDEAKDILFRKYQYIINIEMKKYMRIAKVLGYDYHDLYQDALVGFSDALNSYRDDKNCSLASFITLCVDRKLQVAIKKAGRMKNQLLNESLSLEYIYSSYTAPLKDLLSDNMQNDPLENIVKEEQKEELVNSIKKSLSDNEYEVYCLMVNGLKYDEIATLLDKDLKQVDNAMQRIKNKVKKIIEKR
ncbi:MAG TPA: sigma-70 family RNA polymerase sigma factor [Candidatus Coprovivens excrementavium]|nr:sigma-70 family RNA polymerase sigma factor [Candidatus Coprovivens excrementavium]